MSTTQLLICVKVDNIQTNIDSFNKKTRPTMMQTPPPSSPPPTWLLLTVSSTTKFSVTSPPMCITVKGITFSSDSDPMVPGSSCCVSSWGDVCPWTASITVWGMFCGDVGSVVAVVEVVGDVILSRRGGGGDTLWVLAGPLCSSCWGLSWSSVSSGSSASGYNWWHNVTNTL